MLAAAVPALAAWVPAGSAGSGAARGGAVTAPTVGSPSASGSTVTVTWSGASVPPGATASYYVERLSGASPSPACGSTFAAPITSGSCSDLSVPNGAYTYRVTTRLGNSWQATSGSSASVTVGALSVSSVFRSAGNKKVGFTGGGAAASAVLTVTLCKTNEFPCASGQGAGTSTVTPSTPGTWTSAQSSTNLDNGVTYYARATQGASTSNVLVFTVTAL